MIGAFLSIASASVGRTISFLYPGDDSDYFVGIESYQFVFYLGCVSHGYVHSLSIQSVTMNVFIVKRCSIILGRLKFLT